MNCRKVNHSLSAYIDGELPGVEHRQVHEHLAQCSECRAEYEGLIFTKRLVSRLRMREPRPELQQAIRQRIGSESRPAPAYSVDVLWEKLAQQIRSMNPVGRNLAFGASLAAAGILFVVARMDSSDDIQWTTAPNSPVLLTSEMPDISSQPIGNPNEIANVVNSIPTPLPQNGSDFAPVESGMIVFSRPNHSARPKLLLTGSQTNRNPL